ncbi:MAG: hypothetical protein ACXV8W_15355 [Methylobacter sp.]
MKTGVIALTMGLLAFGTAFGYDNGAQIVGCDYKLGKTEGTDKCLIVGSGLNQGISWLVFEVKGKRFRYADSSSDSIELIDKSGKTIKNYSIHNSNEQCRPGGRSADVYAFSNGDRVCLYWQ